MMQLPWLWSPIVRAGVCECVCASTQSLVVSDSATLWIVAPQAPLSMGFSWHEYGSGLPCPPPRGSSQTRDQPWVSCISGSFFTTEPPGKPYKINKQKDEIEIQQKNQISGADLLNQLDEKCIKIHWK